MLTEEQRRLLTEHAFLPDLATRGMPVRRRLGDDCVGAAALAMVRCAQRWDPALGSFRTYAWHRMRGAAIDHARASSRMNRRHSDVLGQVERSAPMATDAEAAAMAGLSTGEVAQARAARRGGVVLHLDHPTSPQWSGPVDPERPHTLGASLAAAEDDRTEHVALMDAVNRLPDRHASVIVAYDLCGVPQGQLADLWGVTNTRISQIRREALAMLREALTA